MGRIENGHNPDLLDRLFELRNEGISYNQAAFVLAEEGYRNSRGGTFVAQNLQRMYRPFEGVGAVVTDDPDDESRLALFIQCLLVGSKNPGRSGVIFKAQLAAWNSAIIANKGRMRAAEEAVEAGAKLRKGRRMPKRES